MRICIHCFLTYVRTKYSLLCKRSQTTVHRGPRTSARCPVNGWPGVDGFSGLGRHLNSIALPLPPLAGKCTEPPCGATAAASTGGRSPAPGSGPAWPRLREIAKEHRWKTYNEGTCLPDGASPGPRGSDTAPGGPSRDLLKNSVRSHSAELSLADLFSFAKELSLF